MESHIAHVIIKTGQEIITGILCDDWKLKIENRIELYLTFKEEKFNTDFQKLKDSETVLTITIGRILFVDQIIKSFEITENEVKLNTITNREKRPEDFDRW